MSDKGKKRPEPGDHVFVWREFADVYPSYTHHGVMVDGGQVVHFAKEPGAKFKAVVRLETLEEFAGGRTVRVWPHRKRLPPEETVARAMAAIGRDNYNPVTYNCEHLATDCVTGKASSRQVHNVATALVAGNGVRTTLAMSRLWAAPALPAGLGVTCGGMGAGPVAAAGLPAVAGLPVAAAGLPVAAAGLPAVAIAAAAYHAGRWLRKKL